MNQLFGRHETDAAAEAPAGPPPEGDRLRRVVHVVLALYLSPALLLVLAVGGLAVAAEGVVRLAGRAGRAVSAAWPARTFARPSDRRGRALRAPLARRIAHRGAPAAPRGARPGWSGADRLD